LPYTAIPLFLVRFLPAIYKEHHCIIHLLSVFRNAAGTLFLGALPLKGDASEAKAVHKQLLGFIQRSDPR
jgi:hypothetical protein